MQYNWHQHWHHVMPTASPMAALHSYAQDDQSVQHDSFIKWHHWHQYQHHHTIEIRCNIIVLLIWCKHQCHMMPMASSMESLHSLGQGNQNDLQHSLFVHMIPLALAWVASNANSVINGIIAFHRSRWSKWGATGHFGHVMLLASASGYISSMAHVTDASSSTSTSTKVTY